MGGTSRWERLVLSPTPGPASPAPSIDFFNFATRRLDQVIEFAEDAKLGLSGTSLAVSPNVD